MGTHQMRLAVGGAATMLALVTSAVPGAAQQASALQHAVEQALRGEGEMRGITVVTEGHQVTLAGSVETFWIKREALRLTLEVPDVDTVVSELEIPRAEDDHRLAEDVGRALQRYVHNTIWDYIGAVVDQGVVTLSGWVTPDRDKAGEIFERVAKLEGVQDVQSAIEPLPAGREDSRLRQSLARRVFASVHFARFRAMSTPPFRIIVANGSVTLVGYVQGDVERIAMEQIVGQTQGVVRVDNQLEALR